MAQKFINIIFASLLFSTLLFSKQVYGKDVDLKKAQQVALNIFAKESGISKKSITIKEVIPFNHNGELVFRVINFNPTGYIVISAEDNTEPVLGYGLTSNFDVKNIPPALNFLLEEYKREIEYIKDEKLTADEKLESKWVTYSSKEYTSLKSYNVGTYLLETTWGQGNKNSVLSTDYNKYCPIDPNTGKKCIAGCTAVALAQILHYWQCRVFPDETASYTPSGFSSPLTINFYNEDYDWDVMDHNSPDVDNAELIYHCGVAIGVNYNDSSTWILHSQNYKVENALENYFGFQTSGIQYKSSNESSWINMLKADIDGGRPIYYVGVDGDVGGHAWVVDGYRADNTFHCNWGWKDLEDENGFYLLTKLNPKLYTGFTGMQQAILGAEPILDACSGLVGETNICSANESYSVSIPSTASVVWSKSSNLNQVGGNTSPTYTVNASGSGLGHVTATIKNSQAQTFLTRTTNVNVGTPVLSVTRFNFTNGVGDAGYFCTSHSGNEFDLSYYNYNAQCDNYEVKLTYLNGTVVDQFYTSSGTGDLDYSNLNEGYYLFYARGHNDCGWGDWYDTEIEYSDCSQMMLMISPNPTSGEVSLSIEPGSEEESITLKSAASNIAFDETVEWEVEVYSTMQSLKAKQTKIHGNSTKINTQSWTEGVYTVRAKYKDQILTGKLVVKK